MTHRSHGWRMDDDRDQYYAPRLDGFGSASTLNPVGDGKRRSRKRRPIGFALPKPPKCDNPRR